VASRRGKFVISIEIYVKEEGRKDREGDSERKTFSKRERNTFSLREILLQRKKKGNRQRKLEGRKEKYRGRRRRITAGS